MRRRQTTLLEALALVFSGGCIGAVAAGASPWWAALGVFVLQSAFAIAESFRR